MSKCAIVGEKSIRDLIARYEGIGKPLTNDEREILLFHLYNERRRLRVKVVAVRDTIERRDQLLKACRFRIDANGNLDVLRNAALWQSDNHFKHAAGHAGLAMATGGLSIVFDHPDVVAGLVKQFRKDAIGK